MSAVAVVGAGPAGLAVAAMLRREGIAAVVLEAGDEPGAAWAWRYDRLRLHTHRRLSGLPGHAIPRAYGPWVARDDVQAYLARLRAARTSSTSARERRSSGSTATARAGCCGRPTATWPRRGWSSRPG